MTDRVLPYEEWPKLAGTPLGDVIGQLNPATTAILVVEDEQGAMLGCWAALTVLHAEGIWIAEPYRKRGSVMRRLIRRMQGLIRSSGASSVVTGAESEEVRALLSARFAPLPQEYVLCLYPH